MSDASLASDAERMDRHYHFQRHVYDASRTWFLIGRQPLVRELRPAPGQSVLEVGCGTAWNLARAATLYPECRLFGVDVSSAMLQTAKASLARRGLAGRIVLAQGDAARFDAEALTGLARFDRVFISYALSMIPCWREALLHAAGLIAPGGELHIVDFGQCEGWPVPLRSGLMAFLRRHEVTPRADLEAACRSVAGAHSLGLSVDRRHGGYVEHVRLCRKN